jgi:L-rhamnose-H+ transport protein
MSVIGALLLILVAGVVNGSYALPSKYMGRWRFENIWLQFALWTFVILPWTLMLLVEPDIIGIYRAAPSSLLRLMLAGGFAFGVGQVCFALAFDMIGMGLSFVINVGLGMSLGFLLPLLIQHPREIPTPFGLATLLGTALAILGLLFSNHAGRLRDRERKKVEAPGNMKGGALQARGRRHATGVLLTVLTGLTSAGQNAVFSMTAGLQQLAARMGADSFAASSILWPGFLSSAFVPFAFYTLYLHRRNRSFALYKDAGSAKYHFFAVLMGVGWYGSLALYSKASQMIGALGPLAGWPMFMALIILTSNFWGWRHGEWEDSGASAQRVIKWGLACLVGSVVVLGCGASLRG